MVQALAMPWVESPLFPADLRTHRLSESERQLAEHYSEHGYVVLEDAIPPELADRVAAQMMDRYAPGIAEGPRSSYRYQDAWRECDGVRDLALHGTVIETLDLLYGRRPFPFQTLNFRVGSQQANHSDAILFNSLPARFMCGVWVALEDVDADNGPLYYYPGSHKLPEFDIRAFPGAIADPGHFFGYEYPSFVHDLVLAQGLSRRELYLRKGSLLIWASNLVHGGTPIADASRTRASQVTHYFFEDCAYYVPLFSDLRLGELCLIDVRDFRSGAPRPHSVDGAPTTTTPLGNGRHRLSLGETTNEPARGGVTRGAPRFRRPFSRSSPVENGPGLEMHLDSVEETAESIAFSGWAFERRARSLDGGVLRIVLHSEAERHAIDCCLSLRPDVARARKLADSYCGFHGVLRRARAQPGVYRLRAELHTRQGTVLDYDTGRTVDL